MATLYAKNKTTGEFEKVGPVASADGSAIATHNTDSAAHADIREQINTLSNEKVDKDELETLVFALFTNAGEVAL